MAPSFASFNTRSPILDCIGEIPEYAGVLPESGHRQHFGVLVSHVSSRWRRVALATSFLWTRIVWNARNGLEGVARVIAFLERSRLALLDVSIHQIQREDFSPELLRLINDQFGRCRHLRIEDGQVVGDLVNSINYLPNAAPLLKSIDLSAGNASATYAKLDMPLFPSGAPCLRTAQLHNIDIKSMHFVLPAFNSVTSLRFTNAWYGIPTHGKYDALRNALMALPSLYHLELQLDEHDYHDTDLPIVLPTVRYMRLDIPPPHLDMLTSSIRAQNLVALSIEWWNGHVSPIGVVDQSTTRFPLLEHLILTDIAVTRPYLDAYAKRFPKIKRLTFHVDPEYKGCDIAHILRSTRFDAPEYGFQENDTSPVCDRLARWPNLEVIALSATNTHLDSLSFDTASMEKLVSLPLCKLMLPNTLDDKAVADAIAQLKSIIQVEDYSLDWPMPFTL
ncbi:hypothetical protein HWV62_21844 [Athelia sp. TMB]|nr:hypothetical protein HWV62_21844 [Athelia sp. TMB]